MLCLCAYLSLRLTQLRMDRENAESHVREVEDQLAGLQEELRRETDNKAQADTMHMVITLAQMHIHLRLRLKCSLMTNQLFCFWGQ